MAILSPDLRSLVVAVTCHSGAGRSGAGRHPGAAGDWAAFTITWSRRRSARAPGCWWRLPRLARCAAPMVA